MNLLMKTVAQGTVERDPIFSWVDMLEIYLTSASTG